MGTKLLSVCVVLFCVWIWTRDVRIQTTPREGQPCLLGVLPIAAGTLVCSEVVRWWPR